MTDGNRRLTHWQGGMVEAQPFKMYNSIIKNREVSVHDNGRQNTGSKKS